MKYIKTYETICPPNRYIKYVTDEDKSLMYKIRLLLNKYFNTSSIGVGKIKNTDNFHIKIYTYTKEKLTKFIDVLEYIGIGRKRVFDITKHQLEELIKTFEENKIEEISHMVSSANKYNL